MTIFSSKAEKIPFFMSGENAGIFSLYYPSPANKTSNQAVLYFPAFAEEMNKTRHMVALQARKLAETGFAGLVVDPVGTGDSHGDFSDASWEKWRENMCNAMLWLERDGVEKISFLGTRLGCLLAIDVLQYSGKKIENLILWQPVIDGHQYMNQFLRLRTAADLITGNNKLTTREMREKLNEGEKLEVAGYMISPELFQSIDSLKLTNYKFDSIESLHWVEIVSGPERPIGKLSQDAIEYCRQQIDVTLKKVVAEKIWETPEITLAPELLRETTAIFQ